MNEQPRSSRQGGGSSLEKRLAQLDAKVDLLANRPGPERKSGDTVARYKERVKRFEYVTERQMNLAPVHRELLQRRLDKRYEK